MKRNIFLRTAACLLMTTVVSIGLLGGTGAKYAASATATASARVAKFSFVVGSEKYHAAALQGADDTLMSSGPFDNDRLLDAYGNVLSVGNGKTWNEVAVNGGPLYFELPLFDFEYYNPGASLVTVRGSKTGTTTGGKDIRDIVAAPGIGYVYGNFKNNTNRAASKAEETAGGFEGAESIFLSFTNNSEVTVRFKMKAVGSYAPVRILAPLEQDDVWSTHDATLTWNDNAWNIDNCTYPGSGPAIEADLLALAATGGNRWDTYGVPWSGGDVFWGSGQKRFLANDPWMTLAPGEDYTFGISWLWGIDSGSLGQSDDADTYFGWLAQLYLNNKKVINTADFSDPASVVVFDPANSSHNAGDFSLIDPKDVNISIVVQLDVEQVN